MGVVVTKATGVGSRPDDDHCITFGFSTDAACVCECQYVCVRECVCAYTCASVVYVRLQVGVQVCMHM